MDHINKLLGARQTRSLTSNFSSEPDYVIALGIFNSYNNKLTMPKSDYKKTLEGLRRRFPPPAIGSVWKKTDNELKANNDFEKERSMPMNGMYCALVHSV